MPYVQNAGAFLIQTLFGFFALVVMLRFLLQWVRADFYNPLVQFVVKLSNPALVPLRRVIPGLMGVDMAALVLVLAIECVKIICLVLLESGRPSVAGVLVVALADTIALLITVYFWGIIIQALMSWLNQDMRHPLRVLLWQLTAPVLRPAQTVLPPMGGIDLSPILVLIVLQLFNFLLVAPLYDLGRSLM